MKFLNRHNHDVTLIACELIRLNARHSNAFPMTESRLQGLLYMAQGMTLAGYNEPLFNAAITAQEEGPVIASIRKQWNEGNAFLGASDKKETFFNEDELLLQKLLVSVIDYFQTWSATKLRDTARLQQAWQNAARKGRKSALNALDMQQDFNQLITFGH